MFVESRVDYQQVKDRLQRQFEKDRTAVQGVKEGDLESVKY
jgi:hypothetical protein